MSVAHGFIHRGGARGGMEESMRRRLLRLQRMEATEREVYLRLAKQQRNPANATVLEGIAEEEERHEAAIAELTGVEVRPVLWRVWMQTLLARLLGLTFSVKMMERIERDASAEYRELGLDDIADDEDRHEAALIGMLEEDTLRYLGSVILGLSDALVELTGALAGLTFALRSLDLVALAGLVTGIAASFSMAASEYLSTKSEADGRSPAKAAAFTGIAYLATVCVLVLPYLLLGADDPSRMGLPPHMQALLCTLALGVLIVAGFNGYVAVAKDEPFGRRFGEMAGILLVVSAISFAVGMALRSLFGVDL